jgi:hypothetical protein
MNTENRKKEKMELPLQGSSEIAKQLQLCEQFCTELFARIDTFDESIEKRTEIINEIIQKSSNLRNCLVNANFNDAENYIIKRSLMICANMRLICMYAETMSNRSIGYIIRMINDY